MDPAATTTAVLVAGGAVLVTALAVGITAGTVRHDRVSGGSCFRSMCRGLGLSRRQRRLLRSIAGASGLRTPAALLVSRGCFEHARRRAGARGRDAERLAAIAERVFGDRPAAVTT